MTDPKWGTKRTCQSCGAKFYDLRRDPIVCPKCDEVFEPEAEPRPRKRSHAAKPVAKTAAAKKVTESTEIEATEDAPDLEVVVEDADNDEDLIEDTSDLGKDEDDVAEVMEGVVSEDKADI